MARPVRTAARHDGITGSDVTAPLMRPVQVAGLLGTEPESVRSTLRQYRITEERGSQRAGALAPHRSGSGRRRTVPAAAAAGLAR